MLWLGLFGRLNFLPGAIVDKFMMPAVSVFLTNHLSLDWYPLEWKLSKVTIDSHGIKGQQTLTISMESRVDDCLEFPADGDRIEGHGWDSPVLTGVWNSWWSCCGGGSTSQGVTHCKSKHMYQHCFLLSWQAWSAWDCFISILPSWKKRVCNQLLCPHFKQIYKVYLCSSFAY